MYRRAPASTGIHDLDTLEARGAAFVTAQQQPRPRRRRSSAPIARANESHSCSQLSGLNIFGISAYGIILIATVIALIAVLIVFIYLVTFISTHYASN
jgi:Flp pilus assembly protein TadB